jgi:curved DNA-binding protein CbpA
MSPAPDRDPYSVLQIVPTADMEVVHAAYRALALKCHPDRDSSRRAAEKMGELNRAYALVRDPAARDTYDRSRRTLVAGVSVPTSIRATPRASAPMPSAGSGTVLDFGRYSGWALRDLARHDPDYILWLSRHSSGIRFRTEIYGILRTMGVSAA